MGQNSLFRRVVTPLVAATLLTGLVANVQPASALPAVPYCLPAAGESLQQLDAAIMPALCEQMTGRVFPEAVADASYLPDPSGHMNTGFATDFVGFFGFQAGLEYLADEYPDYITIHEVAESFGHPDLTLNQVRLPIYIVEITNKNSPVPMEERQELLFMLSIHGVEKGGREGGFRVLEDLVKGIGFAGEAVQDGLGLSPAIPKPTGGEVETYQDYLDFQRIFLLFPNSDGWVHDEIPFLITGGPCGGNGVLFCRTNANGVDLNRQMPTIGWQFVNAPNRLAMSEPESRGYNNWLVDNHTWDYAIDIHGMLMHNNFVAIMLPAGSFSPQEMARSMRLAETLKERLNVDDHFSEWNSIFGAVEAVDQTICGVVDCPSEPTGLGGGGSITSSFGSTEFAEYFTVWDAIGYTDSGFSGDFFAQSSGLNAPGYDIELAYNHMTVDSLYPGIGALWNDYHVQTVREIVKSFMDAAALDVSVSYETGGSRTLYVESTYVATNLDDEELRPGGWATENEFDDHWEYSEDNPFTARPAKYFEDIIPFVKDGDAPGVLVGVGAAAVTANRLSSFDNLILAGSAINDFIDGAAGSNELADGPVDQARIDAIKAWVEAGGNLVLTDASLKFLDFAGITTDAVDIVYQYAGASDMDPEHSLTDGLVDAVRQTVEPVPLGFAVGNNFPNWYLDEGAVSAAGG